MPHIHICEIYEKILKYGYRVTYYRGCSYIGWYFMYLEDQHKRSCIYTLPY